MSLPPLETLLRELIAIPSVSSTQAAIDTGNRAVIDKLAEWLEALGFSIDIRPLPNAPHKANLIARRGSGTNGLVLSGHTDTVPCDPALWSSDPFRLSERDGRWYGLGTADMKGFFALVIEALRDFPLDTLTQPLIVLATADEETTMAGARALDADCFSGARSAIIGEPTGLAPVRAHKGILTEVIRVIGRSGHSSDPAFGANALEGMHQAIGALLDWRTRLQETHRDERFSVPVPTLNLGHIHGGDNPNRICGFCELHIDLRTLPGMQVAALRQRIGETLRDALANRPDLRGETQALFEGIDALDTRPDAPIVRLCETLTGKPATAVAFGTEGPLLARLGLDAVILGPGDIEVAHRPDEFLRLDRVRPMVDLVKGVVGRPG